jgi:hypothetical protein
MQDILTALDQHPEWRTALRERLLGEELIELPAVFAKFATETTRRLDLLTRELAEFKAETTRRLDALMNDVGQLKGAHAERKAQQNIELIADDLGLEYRRTVPGMELRRLARDNGADVQDDEIKSFVATDIIAEAVDAEGETTYIAVEASYTGDRYDAHRARSHAGLMQRFTNRPCRAVIATARNNERILPLIECGEVAWHQLQVRVQPAG